MPAVFALLGVVLLALAGFNFGGPRFSPAWLGLAFVSLAMSWPILTKIGG